ncbi:Leucine-rich repeat protein [Tieghemiomyces parasiticus]|uniref:Leucine-rich repeat protein n=1 Tax=Tieghemiomyces parasiticus TaxID=78921 RepID=A0A9W8DPZ8_9FUNG|nr:Leucine-rich repeat protein [Tieghemiomyces parasiticus]
MSQVEDVPIDTDAFFAQFEQNPLCQFPARSPKTDRLPSRPDSALGQSSQGSVSTAPSVQFNGDDDVNDHGNSMVEGSVVSLRTDSGTHPVIRPSEGWHQVMEEDAGELADIFRPTQLENMFDPQPESPELTPVVPARQLAPSALRHELRVQPATPSTNGSVNSARSVVDLGSGDFISQTSNPLTPELVGLNVPVATASSITSGSLDTVTVIPRTPSSFRSPDMPAHITPTSSIPSINPSPTDRDLRINVQQLLRFDFNSTTQERMLAMIDRLDATATVDNSPVRATRNGAGPSPLHSNDSPGSLRPKPRTHLSHRRVNFDDPPTASIHRYSHQLSATSSTSQSSQCGGGRPGVAQVNGRPGPSPRGAGSTARSGRGSLPRAQQLFTASGPLSLFHSPPALAPSNARGQPGRPVLESSGDDNNASGQSAPGATTGLTFPSDIDQLSSISASKPQSLRAREARAAPASAVPTTQIVPIRAPSGQGILPPLLPYPKLPGLAEENWTRPPPPAPAAAAGKRVRLPTPTVDSSDSLGSALQLQDTHNPASLVTASSSMSTSSVPATNPITATAAAALKTPETPVKPLVVLPTISTPGMHRITPGNLGCAIPERVGDMRYDKVKCRWVRVRVPAGGHRAHPSPQYPNGEDHDARSPTTAGRGEPCFDTDSYPSLFQSGNTSTSATNTTTTGESSSGLAENDGQGVVPGTNAQLLMTPRPLDTAASMSLIESPDPFQSIDDLQSSLDGDDRLPCTSPTAPVNRPSTPARPSPAGYPPPKKGLLPSSRVPVTAPSPRITTNATATPALPPVTPTPIHRPLASEDLSAAVPTPQRSRPPVPRLQNQPPTSSQVVAVDARTRHIQITTTHAEPGSGAPGHLRTVSVASTRQQYHSYQVPAGSADSTNATVSTSAAALVPSPSISARPAQLLLSSVFHLPEGSTWDLRGRHLISLTDLAPYIGDVEDLDLSDNCLTTVDVALPAVTRLVAARNRLTALPALNPDPSNWWSHLEHLDVSHNRLTNLDALAGLRHLRTLRADGNQVRSLADLGRLPRLLTLSMRGNHLEFIDLDPTVCPRLEQLDLAQNRITSVPAIDQFPRLKLLNLDSNDLGCFHLNGPARQLRTLRISDNPRLGCSHDMGAPQSAVRSCAHSGALSDRPCPWRSCAFLWTYYFPHLKTFYADDSGVNVFLATFYPIVCPMNPTHTTDYAPPPVAHLPSAITSPMPGTAGVAAPGAAASPSLPTRYIWHDLRNLSLRQTHLGSISHPVSPHLPQLSPARPRPHSRPHSYYRQHHQLLPLVIDWEAIPLISNLYLSGTDCQPALTLDQRPFTLPNLVQLELRGCGITVHPTRFCLRFPHMKRLDLRDNPIPELTKGAESKGLVSDRAAMASSGRAGRAPPSGRLAAVKSDAEPIHSN